MWVEALRSGEFEQGVGKLKDGDGKYCCLGVACEVAIRNGLYLTVEDFPNSSGGAACTKFDGQADELPLNAFLWFGLPDASPSIRPIHDFAQHETNGGPCGACAESLAEANDAGIPFTVIADLIEAQLIPEGGKYVFTVPR